MASEEISKEDVSDDSGEERSLRNRQKQELKELRGTYFICFNSRDH